MGLDGTCLLMREEGDREAMVGMLTLYDAQGERQHTNYFGTTPQHGKADVIVRLEREIAHFKSLYPQVTNAGIADGPQSNGTFLEQHTTAQIRDPCHAAQELADAAAVAFAQDPARRAQWLAERCHDWKHKHGAACTTRLKQRLCRAGMRWRERGASIVSSLRALVLSQGRREQFWNKIDQYGLPVEA
jgi:hypothetical protein